MATPTDVLAPALAGGISDRAFRLFCVLVLRTDGGWVPVPRFAAMCGMTSHQIRMFLAELRAADIVETERRYEPGDTGRKTWHTYLRLVDDAPAEVAA
ncbi:putative ArsR family transcriptional regulator [Streptomyces sp. LBL]|uniref:hypothetical protein n=1 Tax=Streptomyces sp. LBL TaxID=2940562 RepID=UPI0024737FC3|nr:hypothetical protein [Streptomyces sp. LBL]MDH6628677.1 putative ArsR family transcriptional regulator [Streptomyces sp. LBL]